MPRYSTTCLERLVLDPTAPRRAGIWLRRMEEPRSSARKVSSNAPVERLLMTEDELAMALRTGRVVVLPNTSGEEFRVPLFAKQRGPDHAFSGFIREQQESGHRILLVAATAAQERILTRRLPRLQFEEVDTWSAFVARPPR